MTIAAKLLTLDGIKTDIKTAIEAKGVDMTGVPFSGYAEKISGVSIGPVDLNYSSTIGTIALAGEVSIVLP